MSSSSSDEVDEALEEIVDQVVDNFFDSVIHAHPNKPTRRAYIERHREQGHNQLWNDYFTENPTYPPEMFRRRFRMNKPLFLRIVERLTNEVPYFQQRRNACGRNGLSALQKCTAAIRMLAYGQSGDTYDEYLRLGDSTSRLCLENFTNAIIDLFGDEYLRSPTPEDLQRLLDVGEVRGFPGMIGSIDCMHWEWKNCPTAWKGQYTRGSGKPTIVLEAVASQDLWIWHAFFGLPGTLNDINVLDRSPVFDDILQGRAPKVKFKVNNHTYRMAYYLTDGIYPKWATFIQSIPLPQGPKAELFAERQESTRKDVERAFGVLQSRFAIVKNPALLWDKEKIGKIMRTCVILHNMIVENERHGYAQIDTSEFESGESSRSSRVQRRESIHGGDMLGIRREVRDKEKHDRLKADLMENIWQKFGNED
ncbi:putative nuclease HARBI1 isoform X1 [Brassica napus]|uniref:putative nuclease HARBI1 isoform X1 n=1 Tax=Brassica napus TaxID=3708 RepID=UPI0020788C80|nr:putative nuclease HARBI1 isoform X1 [Brassica napus]XP_048596577.1 putative nuclease HARBI1 isoform X1 [Brassica napus]XP_048604456.1 putative nuclease HARBI1 [Brassica napus]XP_048604457.1 putative nuclease HARBI1 [Brassica napus]XP_048604458.1 putative nuclease HARBI1 [Brassica napus]XP_048604459.1 putative nuclease HARBI1 [Brassica napus]XP_048604460.1 putative nuclease HARBI1 [Brassica napus]XP_048604461.1 putative nuclease HARBI1 [Brassica napus]XP_048604462.1 putative nuclease HARB